VDPDAPVVVIEGVNNDAKMTCSDTHIYWMAPASTGASTADLRGASLDGTGATVVATGVSPLVGYVGYIAYDGDSVDYGPNVVLAVASFPGYSIKRVRVTSGTVTTIATPADARDTTLHAGAVYWSTNHDTSGNSFVRSDRGYNGAIGPCLTDAFAVDDRYIYCADSHGLDGLCRISRGPGPDERIYRNYTLLSGDVVTYGDYVYWGGAPMLRMLNTDDYAEALVGATVLDARIKSVLVRGDHLAWRENWATPVGGISQVYKMHEGEPKVAVGSPNTRARPLAICGGFLFYQAPNLLIGGDAVDVIRIGL
jgi:hypothetical protein